MKQNLVKADRLRKEVEGIKNLRLISITVVEEQDTIDLLYQFDDLRAHEVTALRVKLPKDKATAPSIMDMFPSAFVYECEAHDLFNVEFEGNKRQHEKLFLADDFKGKAPLRKAEEKG